MEFYEVYVYECGEYFSTIFIHASDRDSAEEQLRKLNNVSNDHLFALTGLVQEK